MIDMDPELRNKLRAKWLAGRFRKVRMSDAMWGRLIGTLNAAERRLQHQREAA